MCIASAMLGISCRPEEWSGFKHRLFALLLSFEAVANLKVHVVQQKRMRKACFAANMSLYANTNVQNTPRP